MVFRAFFTKWQRHCRSRPGNSKLHSGENNPLPFGSFDGAERLLTRGHAEYWEASWSSTPRMVSGLQKDQPDNASAGGQLRQPGPEERQTTGFIRFAQSSTTFASDGLSPASWKPLASELDCHSKCNLSFIALCFLLFSSCRSMPARGS